MKSFLKEIESKFANLQEKDWDGDGEQESPRDEYMGVKDKAIKKAMKKEDAKPDFLDLDGDNDKDEPMKQAAKQANEVIKTSDPDAAAEMQKKNPNVDIELTEDELGEQNVTGAIAGYQTPNAFSTKAQAKKKKNMKYESVSRAMDKKYEAMIESYSKFATGNPKSTPDQTVNGTIKEVAKKLQEIEQLVRYTSRLKNESGIAGSSYKSSTNNALNKISERLLKISERVRSLGE
jgi:hypothetical protein